VRAFSLGLIPLVLATVASGAPAPFHPFQLEGARIFLPLPKPGCYGEARRVERSVDPAQFGQPWRRRCTEAGA
jgi:hypothetical protein